MCLPRIPVFATLRFLLSKRPVQLVSLPKISPHSIIVTYNITGFEQAEEQGFWDESIKDMKRRMSRFNEIWKELDVPYSEPEGGYFVMVNLHKVKLPEDYPFPPHVADRPRDFKLAWFLIQEVGVAAIPPTEFYTEANAPIVEDYLRFAVCKPDDVLDLAKERLRGLKKYIQE
jgi:kynurenine aminotransferase